MDNVKFQLSKDDLKCCLLIPQPIILIMTTIILSLLSLTYKKP